MGAKVPFELRCHYDFETFPYRPSDAHEAGTKKQHSCWFRNWVAGDLSLDGGDSIV